MTSADAAAGHPNDPAGPSDRATPAGGAEPRDGVDSGGRAEPRGRVNSDDQVNQHESANPATPVIRGESAKPAPPGSLLPEQSREDTDAAWGEYNRRDDDHLYQDRPPHWRD